ncbi:hypothetical protein Tco_1382874 [Tanacetum coccineum]
MTPSAPRPPNHVEYQEHLVDEEIEKIVESGDNVDEDEFMDEIFNSQEDLDTRLEPEEESARDALIRKKGKGIVEIKDTPPPTPIRSPRTHIASLSSDKEKLQELTVSDHTHSSSKPRTSSTPKPKPGRVKVAIVHTRDHEDHHDDAARPEGESSTQEDLEDFDAWLNKQGIDDDEVPTKEVSPELLVKNINIILINEKLDGKSKCVGNQRRRFNCADSSSWAQQDHIIRQQKKRDNPDKVHSGVKIVEGKDQGLQAFSSSEVVSTRKEFMISSWA